jgi:predicted phosphodiesterase
MTMRIQFLSDIHLEFGPLSLPPTNADVIVAAGDIGVGAQGLEWLQAINAPVVYVAGNHEFYGREHGSTVAFLRRAAHGSNVRFLEKERHVIGDVRFLGCTLWTDLGGKANDRRDELFHLANDFRQIHHGEGPLTLAAYAYLHQEARSWLMEELEQPFAGKTVIVTHHAPTPWSWQENPNSLLRFIYCNDLREMMHTYDIAAWFHGHTHVSLDYRCAGTRIVCNPRGYHPFHLVRGFDGARFIEI